MIKLKQVSLQFIAAFMLGMLAFSASAQAMPEPQALVKEASDNMLKALKDNEAELETSFSCCGRKLPIGIKRVRS